MLRRILILASALALVIAVVLLFSGVGGTASLIAWLAIQAGIVLVALLAERGRYRPRTTGTDAGWQRTAERFQDPTTGQWVSVEYNPQTGERRYVPESPNQV